MPTGACKFPEHHGGSSAGQVISLIICIALGAIVVAHWRTVVVCLIVTGVLLTVVAAVMAMWHRRHESAAEHQAWLVERQAELDRRTARQQVTARQPQQIHNHVHLHGVRTEDIAGIIARRPQPIAIEKQQVRPPGYSLNSRWIFAGGRHTVGALLKEASDGPIRSTRVAKGCLDAVDPPGSRPSRPRAVCVEGASDADGCYPPLAREQAQAPSRSAGGQGHRSGELAELQV
jgi:hypothetical protein